MNETRSYCDGTGAEWYTGCPDRDRLARLATENGVDTADLHDAPEKVAESVLYLIEDDSEDATWLRAEWPAAAATVDAAEEDA